MRGGDHPTRYKLQDRGPEPSEGATAERMTDRTGDPTSDRFRTPARIPDKARVIKYTEGGVEIMGRQGGRPRGMYVVIADAS